MALIWQDVTQIREATYGIETREPIADALTQFNEKLKTRVNRISVPLYEDVISWIEYVEHVIHDTPTLYSLTTVDGDISVSVISGTSEDYKVEDGKSTDTTVLIQDQDYRMTVGNAWSKTALDDPTHIETETVIHYDYCLKIERANGR